MPILAATGPSMGKMMKAISKKSGKDFDDVCNLFATKSKERGIPEAVIDEVLALMAKFGGYAFNRSHACSYALLSYYTAYLRNYYPSEWLAACIQIDRLDEDKLAVLLKECSMDRINVKPANVNESGVETTVNKKGEILLPLSAIKGVGARAIDIVQHQPYEDCKDLAYRARPNRGMVAFLAEQDALCCLPDTMQFEVVEDFLEYWDNIVAERNKEEKNSLRMQKLAEKNSVSYDDIINNKEIFKEFEKNKEIIEKEFGEELEWQLLPDRAASRLKITKSNCDLENEDNWEEYVNWLIGKLEKLYYVFNKRLADL